MMIHPQFDPIAISIGPVAIRWYALSYIVGFMLFLWLGRRRIKQGNTAFTKEMLDDFAPRKRPCVQAIIYICFSL